MAAPKGNKFALGLTNSGRPPTYDKPEKLYDKIIEYFDYIQGEYKEVDSGDKDKDDNAIMIIEVVREPEPLTIIGLSIYLGFSSKGTLYEYAKKKEFSDYIKRALSFVEQKYEEMLMSKSCTGAIFALKNMGWKDKVTTELEGGLNINEEDLSDYTTEDLKAIAKIRNKYKKL